MIKGNTLIPDFQISFFYDKNQEIVHYSTPTIDLPSDKCLQLWGDIEGEMIPLGVLNQTVAGSFTTIVFDSKMESFNVTIEDKLENVFQDHPDVSQLVGSISI